MTIGERRRKWAADGGAAVYAVTAQHVWSTGDDMADGIVDTITAVLHYAKGQGLDAEELSQRALRHFEYETDPANQKEGA